MQLVSWAKQEGDAMQQRPSAVIVKPLIINDIIIIEEQMNILVVLVGLISLIQPLGKP